MKKAINVTIEYDAPLPKDGVELSHSVVRVSAKGVTQTLTVPITQTSFLMRVEANSNVRVEAETFEVDGDSALAVAYEFPVGNLEGPNAITNFRHSFGDVVEIEDDAQPIEIVVAPTPEPEPPADEDTF